MRRKDRQMSEADARNTLKRGTWGVLSMCAGDEPYGVPINYVYSPEDNAVFFHCAPEGKKLEMLASNGRVSFTVVTGEQVVPEKFTTLYESVIASGEASLINDGEEKRKRLIQLCEALSPDVPRGGEYIGKCLLAAAMVRIDIDEVTGKSNT